MMIRPLFEIDVVQVLKPGLHGFMRRAKCANR
jgi:hypothetical protein